MLDLEHVYIELKEALMMMDINQMLQSGPESEGLLLELPKWSESMAREIAGKEGITLTDEHWEVIHLLRDHYRVHGNNLSGTHLLRALEEPFGNRGGRKHLYQLFPGGPVNQGCKLAGLPTPPYSKDPSFGSVQ